MSIWQFLMRGKKMKALNKPTKTILSMMCRAVVILMILQLSSMESFGQTPLTIKVEKNGREVKLTANNYSNCEWTSSSQDMIYVYPPSGQTTTGTALSWTRDWIVITCRCATGGGMYQSKCVELYLSSIVGLSIQQGCSGISRGESGPCQCP